MTPKREYAFALLAGAAGAGLVILAVRQQWAQAVFTPPKPLTPQVVDVSGSDLVPLAGALALAALAGLAAVIATRGVLRRAAGRPARAVRRGRGRRRHDLRHRRDRGLRGGVQGRLARVRGPLGHVGGSTTSGSTGSGSFVVSGSTGQAIMTGTPWHVAVLIGALLIFVAGLATALRGPDWPVMSARYDAPGTRGASGAGRVRRPARGRWTRRRCGSR